MANRVSHPETATKRHFVYIISIFILTAKIGSPFNTANYHFRGKKAINFS